MLAILAMGPCMAFDLCTPEDVCGWGWIVASWSKKLRHKAQRRARNDQKMTQKWLKTSKYQEILCKNVPWLDFAAVCVLHPVSPASLELLVEQDWSDASCPGCAPGNFLKGLVSKCFKHSRYPASNAWLESVSKTKLKEVNKHWSVAMVVWTRWTSWLDLQDGTTLQSFPASLSVLHWCEGSGIICTRSCQGDFARSMDPGTTSATNGGSLAVNPLKKQPTACFQASF